ncbi:MAG TPA: low affinity iron permease family protein [Paraburkholderia sp.]|jgi:low affinity Fe/Cu permease|nr:low affinity iron permease family protein [Paraburkholderia sp.]
MKQISRESPAVSPGPSDGSGSDGHDRRHERAHAGRSRPLSRLFDRLASAATRWAGTPMAFCAAVFVIVVWLVAGPIFHYSDGWQLVVNTGTTIVTFMMVFLLQQSQNKDSVAVHLKLDELLSSQRAANNALIGIENASEEELQQLAAAYMALASKHRVQDAGDEGRARRGALRTSREPDAGGPAHDDAGGADA